MAHRDTAPGRAIKALDKLLHDLGVIGKPRQSLLLSKFKKKEKSKASKKEDQGI